MVSILSVNKRTFSKIAGMIMGAAASTVYYNLRLRHPTLDMPIIDYDLALLLQPMLMLGISFGVTFNVMFADWMVTVLLIILFTGTDTTLTTLLLDANLAPWSFDENNIS